MRPRCENENNVLGDREPARSEYRQNLERQPVMTSGAPVGIINALDIERISTKVTARKLRTAQRRRKRPPRLAKYNIVSQG
jgi:hypothetical protein